MKRKRTTKRRPRRSPAAKQSPNLLLATRTLTALAIVLQRNGLTLGQIERTCSNALRAAATAPQMRHDIPVAKDSALLGTALTLWHRHPSYVTRQGTPKPLTLHGSSNSVQALLRQAGFKRQSRKLAIFLNSAGLLVRATRGKFLPIGRAARMPDINALFVEHIALGVMKLMQTVQHNFSAAGKQAPLLQRAAAVRHLPRKHHEAFREFVIEQGNAFVTNVDDWLEARSAKSSASAPSSMPAGVYAFAYVG